MKSKKKGKALRGERSYKGNGIALSRSLSSPLNSTGNFFYYDAFVRASQEDLDFIVKKHHIPFSVRFRIPNEDERPVSLRYELPFYIDLLHFGLRLPLQPFIRMLLVNLNVPPV